MKMDTVWQAKVADSAMKIGLWMWRVHLAIGLKWHWVCTLGFGPWAFAFGGPNFIC